MRTYVSFWVTFFLGISLNFSWCSQGSVVVDFRVTFDEDVSDDQAASILKNDIKDGQLGSFKVDSTSVESISPTSAPRGNYCIYCILENVSWLLVAITAFWYSYTVHMYMYMGLHDLKYARNEGWLQLSTFSRVKLNVNEQKPLFELICTEFGIWKVQRLNWAKQACT